MPVLVDSSLWVHQFRRSGDPAKRARVNRLLIAGDAAWCSAVRLELWAGIASDVERRTLRRYEGRIPDYPITDGVWDEAMQLASRGRRVGVTVPAVDVLIFACAMVHELDLAHDDGHFDQLAKLVE